MCHNLEYYYEISRIYCPLDEVACISKSEEALSVVISAVGTLQSDYDIRCNMESLRNVT